MARLRVTRCATQSARANEEPEMSDTQKGDGNLIAGIRRRKKKGIARHGARKTPAHTRRRPARSIPRDAPQNATPIRRRGRRLCRGISDHLSRASPISLLSGRKKSHFNAPTPPFPFRYIILRNSPFSMITRKQSRRFLFVDHREKRNCA